MNELFRGARGEARLSRPAPGVLFFALEGHADREMLRFIRSAGDLELAITGTVTIFYDTTSMRSFKLSFRQGMVVWHAKNRGRLFHVALVRSSLIASMITGANKVIGGGAEVTSSRRRFDDVLAETVAAHAPTAPDGEPTLRDAGDAGPAPAIADAAADARAASHHGAGSAQCMPDGSVRGMGDQ